MRKLLVATDLSERSDIALARAIALAQQLPAELTVLYVVESDLPDEVAQTLLDAADPVLRKRITALSDQGKLDPTIRIERGRDWALISEMAQDGAHDVIVMGAHRPTWRELTRGSTLDRVIRLSGVPVLIAATKGTKPYQQILAGVDFSLPSRRAVALAASFDGDATLRLVHVYNEPLGGILAVQSEQERVSAIEQMLADEIGNRDQRQQVVIKHGEIIGALYDEARSWPADLLVLGTHGRTGVGLAILGSIAEQFVADPPCDLLVVKAW